MKALLSERLERLMISNEDAKEIQKALVEDRSQTEGLPYYALKSLCAPSPWVHGFCGTSKCCGKCQ